MKRGKKPLSGITRNGCPKCPKFSTSAVPLERSANNNCNDDIDNDCDNLCDFTPSGCPAGTGEGADCQSCTGAGGIGCFTSKGTGWSQVVAGTPYCNAVSGSTYECYGCSSGWTYTGGNCCLNNYVSGTPGCTGDAQCCSYTGNPGGAECSGGTCIPSANCLPVCWSTTCISGGRACCQTTCGTTNFVCNDNNFLVTTY